MLGGDGISHRTAAGPSPLPVYLLLPPLGFWQLAVLMGLSLLVKRRHLHQSCWNGVPGLLRYPVSRSPGALSPCSQAGGGMLGYSVG